MTQTTMSQRHEFVLLAQTGGVNFRTLCRSFKISAKTGYKWRRRFAEGGVEALADRSRRPKSSPQTCKVEVAEAVIALRRECPTWGGHKLRRRLQDLDQAAPAASTCTAVLRRAGLLATDGAASPQPWQRFERSQPNELWQMDFKGHFPTQAGPRCHPLTVLDDHSRFNLVLSAGGDEQGATVQAELTAAFARYGLPEAMLCDNGPPWGCAEPVCPYTSLGVWLLRLGVRVLHGRPYHPQTQGKDERFHRTLGQDLIARHTWRDLAHCHREFQGYRHRYNCERPHHSLQLDTPVSRYQPSPRPAPAALPPIEYELPEVRKVHANGAVMFRNQSWYVGQWEVFFSHLLLGLIDLHRPKSSKYELHSIYAAKPSTPAPGVTHVSVDVLPLSPA